jgi:hypothetical protein
MSTVRRRPTDRTEENQMKKTQPAIIDGKLVRVETPEHQNARMAAALERWNRS